MYNNNERISASEINKFTYCPYQWYYERKYGTKYIRQKFRKANPDYFFDKENKFLSGNHFHKFYRMKYMIKRVAIIILILATIFFVYWCFLWNM